EPDGARGAGRGARRAGTARDRPSRGRGGRRQPADPERGRRGRRRRARRDRKARMSGEQVVLYERRGPAAWISLNRPEKLNALSTRLVYELRTAIWRAADDDEAKVAVVTGAGRAFSAG